MTGEKLKIESFCIFRNNKVSLNGELFYEDSDAVDLKRFAKSVYRFAKPSYAKFFKMDDISKLGFLAAEILLRNIDVKEYNPEDVSIILSNSDSTLLTDKNHQDTISNPDNYFPSPSIFVYTLPNIMTGEISIRHGLKGENSFFIVEKFNADLIANHINTLFLTDKTKAAIGGWVNQTETDYEAFIYFASVNGNIVHAANEITELYNKSL